MRVLRRRPKRNDNSLQNRHDSAIEYNVRCKEIKGKSSLTKRITQAIQLEQSSNPDRLSICFSYSSGTGGSTKHEASARLFSPQDPKPELESSGSATYSQLQARAHRGRDLVGKMDSRDY
eukprot:m.51351 g.51351  ORF g.51351 m.51351 type:complete len:120 (-) comp48287_c0_seq1:2597-2956(-)